MLLGKSREEWRCIRYKVVECHPTRPIQTKCPLFSRELLRTSLLAHPPKKYQKIIKKNALSKRKWIFIQWKWVFVVFGHSVNLGKMEFDFEKILFLVFAFFMLQNYTNFCNNNFYHLSNWMLPFCIYHTINHWVFFYLLHYYVDIFFSFIGQLKRHVKW